MSRALMLLGFLLAIPSALVAQTPSESWSNLSRLKAGRGIEVIETSMKRHSADFVAVSDELLTVRENGSEVSLQRGDVARVSTSSGSKRGEHALIGLAVGGAVGAAIGAASGSAHGFLGGSSRGITALVGIVIGAPAGAAVGAVVPAHTTLYRTAPVAASPNTNSPSGQSSTALDCPATPALHRQKDCELLLSPAGADLGRSASNPAPLPTN